MRALEGLLERVDSVRKNGDGYKALCPAHDDKNPSLSIKQGDKGLLIKCFAGCSTQEIAAALNIEMKDLFSEERREFPSLRTRRKRKEIACYEYLDAAGKLLFQVVRFDPKDFRQRRPDGKGGWVWNLHGLEPVLYRLPEVMRAVKDGGTVYVVEGEKDADRLRDLGFTATTAPMGARKWKPGYAEALRDANVVIVPDADKPGREHAEQVARSLQGVAESVKVLSLPGLQDGGDVSDYLDNRGTVEELFRLASTAPVWEPREREVTVGQLLSGVVPETVEWLWHPRIPLGKITVIDGDPGLGKSALTTDFAACITTGKAWPDGTPCPAGGVVLISGEDGLADTIRPRLDAAGGDASKVLTLAAMPDERAKDGGERMLSIPEDLDYIRRGIERVGALLVVVDPIMAFLSGNVKSHNDQDVRRALSPLSKLAEETGAAFLLVRHLNKSSGGKSIYRGGGSIGIIGAARSGLVIAADPDDENRRVLAPIKSNLAEPAPSLAFALVEADNGAVRVEYKGLSSHSADTLLTAPDDPEEKTALDEAKEFLADELSDGPMAAKQVKKNARDADYAHVRTPTIPHRAHLGAVPYPAA